MILIIDAPDIKKKWRITNDGTLSFKLERWHAPGRNPKTGTISQREHDVFGHASYHSTVGGVVDNLFKEGALSQDEATSIRDAVERAEKSILAALQKALEAAPTTPVSVKDVEEEEEDDENEGAEEDAETP